MELTQSASWHALQHHYSAIAPLPLRELFNQQPERFQCFSLNAANLFLDYSKNRITTETMRLLTELAHACDLATHIEQLFSGFPVNTTEQRPALHTALRDLDGPPLLLDGHNITTQVLHSLEQMQQALEQLESGAWSGYDDQAFRDVIHIGIGGSHLGPLLASQALNSYHTGRWRCQYVSSIDATQLHDALVGLNPATTLFVIASKSFTTQETSENAARAKQWLLQSAPAGAQWQRHFIATTANAAKARDAGLLPDRILPLAEWVGGRYSLWSSVGFPLVLSIGMEAFKTLLAGAAVMDAHFRHSPFTENMPVILALLGIWYIDFFGTATQAILPYDYRLRSLPRYLQQLDMESNGKHVHNDGSRVTYATAPITFGDVGTDSQHSFHQLLFQGTHTVPCDFIATRTPSQPLLLAHCFAQSRALMNGKTEAEANAELRAKGYDDARIHALAPHQTIAGNQPSNTILLDELTPYTLGTLLALYEHKTFVQGVIWGIDSFDQWGVELGKHMAQALLPYLTTSASPTDLDSSTMGLLDYVRLG